MSEVFQKADALLQAKEFAQAYSAFLQLAKADPQNDLIRIKIAEACVGLGRTKDALKLYKHLAANMLQKSQVVQAIGINKRILELDPQDTEIQQRIAELSSSVFEDTSKEDAMKARAVAQEKVKAMAQAPIVVAAQIPEAAIDTRAADDASIFDLASNLEVGEAPATVELTIGGHDGYNVLDMGQEAGAHLTLMGGAPMTPTLTNIPLFSELPPKAFQQLMTECKRFSAAPETVLVRQGEPGDSIFVVSYGTVRALQKKPDGSVKMIAEIRSGDFCGEFAYFSKRPREASLVAVSPVEMLEFSRAILDRIVVEYPKVERAMHKLYRERILENLLREAEIFSPLSEDERKAFSARFTHRTFAKGQTVLKEGDPADAFYVIQSGSVSVVKAGVPQPLAQLKEADFFGEYAMITGTKRTASVVALENTELLGMNRETFVELLRTKSEVWEKVKAIATARMAANAQRQPSKS